MQWDASEEWHTTWASNDLTVGGKLLLRMEASDGGTGFDFAATYTQIEPHRLIEFRDDAGRLARLAFIQTDTGVTICQTFDAEAALPEEEQRLEWQIVLDRFARYVERQCKKDSQDNAMYGPQPGGFWSGQKAVNSGSVYQFLTAGRSYRVVREFADFDGDRHLAGETWQFCGHSFVPYDDGLSLFVSLDGRQEWQLRLQQRADEQGPLLDTLTEYIEQV